MNRLNKLTKLGFAVNDYEITEATYLQLLNVVESKPAARNRHLAIIRCPTTDDFKDLLRATVKVVKKSPTESDEVIYIF